MKVKAVIKSRIISDGEVLYEHVSSFEETQIEVQASEALQSGEYYLIIRITAIPVTFVPVWVIENV